MDYSVTFARHFARLLWLLLHELENVDEQKGMLRALVMLSREGPITLTVDAGELSANGSPLTSLLAGVTDLVDRMTSHDLETINVDVGASPADLLGAARILAGILPQAAGASLGTTVRLIASGDSDAHGGTTPEMEIVLDPVVDSRPDDTRPAGALPDLDLGEVLEDPLASAAEEERARPSSANEAPASGIGAGHAPGSFEALVAQLDVAERGDVLARVLDGLAAVAGEAERAGRWSRASEILYRIVRRERAMQDLDAKRAFMRTVRAIGTPPLLRAIAAELPDAPERREQNLAVLARAGEEGADALIEQLVAAGERGERRVYFDALVELKAGVPTLLTMLGDPRWFVARNAAALLGEMKARQAEKPLSELAHHDDERVRHAATIALMRLGTQRSLPAIEQALTDGAPRIRMQAAAELVARRDAGGVAALVRALGSERDDEVRAAFLLALGKLATPEAVGHLIGAAQPERSLFRRKPVGVRIAALQALAEARTPEAMDGLRALMHDKDADVREAAGHALRRIGRKQ